MQNLSYSTGFALFTENAGLFSLSYPTSDMFIFDHPYISDVAEEFLISSQSPLLKNDFATECISEKTRQISDQDAIAHLKNNDCRWLYSNSENAIAWINQHLGKESALAQRIDLFKDKHKFREATRELFPDITFQKISAADIDQLSYDEIGQPFIIKPVVGFISAGVYRVDNAEQWSEVQSKIQTATAEAAAVFPTEVLNSNFYIIESIIEGVEYAVDSYFDEDNNPVVLNILQHYFNGEQDMSDRLYLTSAEIIRTQLQPIEDFLKNIAKLGDFRGMPIHTEVRIDKNGVVRPIEINPLRFAGWCSTDIAYFAYGLNVYRTFAEKARPDWEQLLKGKERDKFAMGVIEKPQPLTAQQSFDFDALGNRLSDVLSMRKLDYRKFPLFAFVFFHVTPETEQDLETVLTLNPQDFVK